MSTCLECGHLPSMRDGDPDYCSCACHDIADAAPALLAACKMALADELDDSCLCVHTTAALRAAIAQAEPFLIDDAVKAGAS